MKRLISTPGSEKGSQIPHLEHLQIWKSYAFTINPSQLHQEKNTKERLKEFQANMIPVFKALKTCTLFSLYLELSPSKQNLHYHGYICFTNLRCLGVFYLNVLPLICTECQIEIDTINDPVVWAQYVTKQRHIMEPLCLEYKVKYKIKNNINFDNPLEFGVVEDKIKKINKNIKLKIRK